MKIMRDLGRILKRNSFYDRNLREGRRKFQQLMNSTEYKRDYLKIQNDYIDRMIYSDSDPAFPAKRISEIINQ